MYAMKPNQAAGMKTILMLIPLLFVSAGCGGGASGPPNPAQPPDPAPSPGGHWSDSAQDSPSHFYISETGTVRAILATAPAAIPIIAAGTVSTSATGAVSGSLQASDNQPVGRELGCSLSGTLEERVSLQLEVTCSGDTGIDYDENLTMSPQPGYDIRSSLNEIAGNYTPSIALAPNVNSLSIAADGTMFGTWDRGQQCMVNGLVSIIDPDYNFLSVEWQFSNCTGPFSPFDHAQLNGLAIQQTSSSWPAGTYSFILTGTSDSGFTVVFVTYVPA